MKRIRLLQLMKRRCLNKIQEDDYLRIEMKENACTKMSCSTVTCGDMLQSQSRWLKSTSSKPSIISSLRCTAKAKTSIVVNIKRWSTRHFTVTKIGTSCTSMCSRQLIKANKTLPSALLSQSKKLSQSCTASLKNTCMSEILTSRLFLTYREYLRTKLMTMKMCKYPIPRRKRSRRTMKIHKVMLSHRKTMIVKPIAKSKSLRTTLKSF